MRFSRHAKNRVRLIQRLEFEVSEQALLDALPNAEEEGYDERGNRRLRVRIGAAVLTVVLDERRQIVITVWREA